MAKKLAGEADVVGGSTVSNRSLEKIVETIGRCACEMLRGQNEKIAFRTDNGFTFCIIPNTDMLAQSNGYLFMATVDMGEGRRFVVRLCLNPFSVNASAQKTVGWHVTRSSFVKLDELFRDYWTPAAPELPPQDFFKQHIMRR